MRLRVSPVSSIPRFRNSFFFVLPPSQRVFARSFVAKAFMQIAVSLFAGEARRGRKVPRLRACDVATRLVTVVLTI